VLWSAVSKHGQIITFHEHYQKEWTVKQHAEEIRRINKSFGREPDLYVADPSIKNRNAVTNTSIHQEYVAHGIAFTLGNNAVKDGIVRVKGYLAPSHRNTRTEVVNGKTVKTLLPMWQVTPNCQKLIWEMKRYRWKTYQQKKLQYENNAYEEPQKKDDHACDSLRYMIMTRPDLRADDSFADNIDEIVNRFGVVQPTSRYSEIADPNELMEDENWTTDNTIPLRQGEWEFDEHMGGVY
jgi:hypothetical protein